MPYMEPEKRSKRFDKMQQRSRSIHGIFKHEHCANTTKTSPDEYTAATLHYFLRPKGFAIAVYCERLDLVPELSYR
jgi:hypothetical protein